LQMAFSGHNEIDRIAIPDEIPRVGDNLPKLYHNHPPSPIRCHSTLRPMHLTPSDFKALEATQQALSPRTSGHATTPRRKGHTVMTSYERFFEAPVTGGPDGAGSFNNPHAHRLVRGAFESSHTSYIFGSRTGGPAIPMPPPAVMPRDTSCVPTNTTPRLSSVSPAPSPRKTYVDRVMAQSETEEQQLLAIITARKAQHEYQRSAPRQERNIDMSKMKNLFLQSEEQPHTSPRRRVLLW
jgi:hypothetical protein